MPLLPDRHPQKDFFILDISDVVPKDDMASMEHPLFSLATKPDMRMALYQRAGLDERDDNRVDAWWLRQVGLHLLGDPDALNLPKTHLAALDKIRRIADDTEVPF